MQRYNIKDLHKQVRPQGIYFDMPIEEYHKDLSLSNSGMGRLLQTPKHYWHKSGMNPNKPPIDSDAFRQGRLLHTLLLEPEKFEAEWTIKPNVKTTKEKGKIGEGEYNTINNAIKSLRADKFFNDMFLNGFPEVSIFWIDKNTGVPCRVRIDYLTSIVLDLKSALSISTKKLKWSVIDYGYHRQAALYLHALIQIKKIIKKDRFKVYGCPNEPLLDRILSKDHSNFTFVWQEKKLPFVTRASTLSLEHLEVGADQACSAINIFKENYEKYGTNPWPSGYEGKVEVIEYGE